MPGRHERRAAYAVAAGALLTAAIVALSTLATREQRVADEWVSRTRDVLEAGQRAAGAYQDVPLHSERYVVTRDPKELALVADGQRRLDAEVETIRRLTADNPAQQKRVADLRSLADDGYAYNLRLRRAGTLPELRAAILSRPVKPLDNVRRLTQALVDEEQRLLVERRRRLDRAFRLTRLAFVAACLLAIGGLAAAAALLLADVRRREELARSNEELERFAYVASHDLKEPLRMVVSYTQLLERRYKGKLDADADEFIRFAVDGARRMHEMIDGLLEFSRAGRGGERAGDVDAGACLQTALLNLRAAIEDAGARVVAGTLPTVRGTQLELTRVFQNLVGNALKFRVPGRPAVVRVDAERRGGEWVFRVEDNGIGIAAEDVPKLFVLFQRLHGRNQYPGTGLGLAICKKLVESRDGRMWVEGKPGEGTTFYFTAPAPGAS